MKNISLKKAVPSGQCGRKGLLLLVGGMKKDTGIQCAGATATAFFRTISVPEHETLSYLSIDKKGAIINHPSALNDAYEAGARLVALNCYSGVVSPSASFVYIILNLTVDQYHVDIGRYA